MGMLETFQLKIEKKISKYSSEIFLQFFENLGQFEVLLNPI